MRSNPPMARQMLLIVLMGEPEGADRARAFACSSNGGRTSPVLVGPAPIRRFLNRLCRRRRQSAASGLSCTVLAWCGEARRLPKGLVDCAQARQRHNIANDDGAPSLDGAFCFQQGERGVYLGTAGANEQGQFAL